MSTPNAVIEQQMKHHSVRHFENKEVADDVLHAALAAGQRASTSSNLQSWSVVVLRDDERKQKLASLVGGMPYISGAPVFLVWLADLRRDAEIVADNGGEAVALDYLDMTLVGAIDAALAAQNTLLAAESLGLGGVFVGGIRNNPAGVSELLNLPSRTFAVFGMALGYPSEADAAGLKPRLPLETVVHNEEYDETAWREGAKQYEADYEAYFASQGRPGRSWIETVQDRVGSLEGLKGRETLSATLRELGFPSE